MVHTYVVRTYGSENLGDVRVHFLLGIGKSLPLRGHLLQQYLSHLASLASLSSIYLQCVDHLFRGVSATSRGGWEGGEEAELQRARAGGGPP